MQSSEQFFYFISVDHRKQYENDRDTGKKKESVVLVVTDIIASEGQQYCAHEPSDRADNKKFFCGQMPQAEDVT